MNHRHRGSSFESFLEDEGISAEVEAGAIKKLLALQIQRMMQENRLSKAAMAQKMRTSRSVLDRLLDPESDFVTLQTLERAAMALGKRLKVELV